MHKTFLDAKPNCGLHDFTLQSLQYITSIMEAGNDSSEAQEATNEGWKREEISADQWRGHETETESRLWYDFTVDEWRQSRRAAFGAQRLTPDKCPGQNNLPCCTSQKIQNIWSVPSNSHSSTITGTKIWLWKIHPEPHLHNTGCHCPHFPFVRNANKTKESSDWLESNWLQLRISVSLH